VAVVTPGPGAAERNQVDRLTAEAQPGSTPSDRQDPLGVGGTDVAGRLAALRSFRCCGAPAMCGARCQDDEISDLLAFANAEIDRLTAERDEQAQRAGLMHATAQDWATRCGEMIAERDEAQAALHSLKAELLAEVPCGCDPAYTIRGLIAPQCRHYQVRAVFEDPS
jgi:hypothetical protein